MVKNFLDFLPQRKINLGKQTFKDFYTLDQTELYNLGKIFTNELFIDFYGEMYFTYHTGTIMMFALLCLQAHGFYD